MPIVLMFRLQIAKAKPQKELTQVEPAKPAHKFYNAVRKPLPQNINQWLSKVDEKKSQEFKMTEYAGDHSTHEPSGYGCDFDKISTAEIVTKIEVFIERNYVKGYTLTYSKTDPITRGKQTPTVKTFTVDEKDKITAVTLHAASGEFGSTKVIYGIAVATARARSEYLGVPHQDIKSPASEREDLLSSAPHPNWSFKGFWYEEGNAFDRMGLFYGFDAKDPVENLVVL